MKKKRLNIIKLMNFNLLIEKLILKKSNKNLNLSGSFIADNNSSDGESELKEMGINEDFDRDYHSRLNDEIQGERERY